ncbi:MAG: hypothetical protein P8J59_06330 [Phycisphaerales bacterium]|jgi:hypothetical protein|nr:hypothetical protein [Phycisphaerales bacterium]
MTDSIGVNVTRGCSTEGSRSNSRCLRRAFGRLVISGLSVAAVSSVGGCMVDCEDSYCDVVRAGGTAVEAWHFHCCLHPDDPSCADLPDRVARFSLLAAEARLACEARNWDRIRDIWREFRQVVPLQFASVVWKELCERHVAWGENVWSPFGVGTEFDFALTLDQVAVPQVTLWNGDRSDSVEIVRSYLIRDGSKVAIRTPRGLTTAYLQGRLTLARTASLGGDLEEWCLNHRPVELVWSIESDGWSGSIGLDADFEGNRVRFETASTGIIGVAVRLSIGRDDLPEISTVGLFEHAYLELPFHLTEDGDLRIAPDGPLDGLQLIPLDPRLEQSLRSAGSDDGLDDGEGCSAFARERAEAFLAAHANCDVRITDGLSPGN